MGRSKGIIAVFVAAVVLGCMGGVAVPAIGAQAKTCESAAGRYEVTPPPAGSRTGADPAAVAAADCTLGFHEDKTYPLSVIGLAVLATLGTLLLLRRRTSHDAIGSAA
jgi:LPXTG-motif cell wall-anchored protein